MLKSFIKVVSMTLVVVLLINVPPVIAIEELEDGFNDKVTSPEKAPIQEDIINQEITVLGELDKKRSEYTKQYLLSDGTRVANVYADPVHYEKDGQWEEIDNTLVVKRSGTYSNAAGNWDVSFPQQLNQSKQITITKDGYTLSFGMAGRLERASGAVTAGIMAIGGTSEPYAVSAAQTAQAQIQQVDLSEAITKVEHEEFVQSKLYSRLTYADVYANTDVVYDLQSNKVKESVLLSRYDSNLRGYRYTLNTGGLIPVLDETGHIEFYDAAMQNIVMTMPAPFLVDANNAYNFDIQVQLIGSGSTYTLTYLLPQKWLADSERAYPVVLDPVVQAGTGVNNIADQTVFSKGSKYYTWIVVGCGYDVNMGKERFFMAFTDLPELTASDVITGAAVGLYKPYSSSTPFYVSVHDVFSTWSSSTITWANMPSTSASAKASLSVTSPGWYYWDITNIAKRWYSTGVNTGMMFKASDAVEAAAVNHWSQFYSSDNGSYSPTLTIEYQTITDLSVDDSYEVEISLVGQEEFFSFTPSATGFYTFDSSDNVGDPYVSVYNSSLELLAEDNDTAGDHNFRLTYHLIEEVEYRITVGSVGDNGAFFTLNLYEPTTAIPLPATTITSGLNYTVSIENEYEQVYYKFTPTSGGEYIICSANNSDDPHGYLYNSSYAQICNDDDKAGSLNFWISDYLSAGQTYYIVASCYGDVTGTYTFVVLPALSALPSGNYYLRNCETDAYLSTFIGEEWGYQCPYTTDDSNKWKIIPQGDGYYAIQSRSGDNLYLGISNTNIGVDNIRLYSTVSSSTRWKIYVKSENELIFEPQNAPGRALCSPNSTNIEKLRLDRIGANTETQKTWTFATLSWTTLEGQNCSVWCWAAAAKMFANHYTDVPFSITQEDVVTAVLDAPLREGGDINETKEAVEYLLEDIETAKPTIAARDRRILNEDTLRRYLNDGHVVYIGVGKYRGVNRISGHASVVVGYSTSVENGVIKYQYIIYDPWPEDEPESWDHSENDDPLSNPVDNEVLVETTGQVFECSYESLCNGTYTQWDDTPLDSRHWDRFLVIETDYLNDPNSIIVLQQ